MNYTLGTETTPHENVILTCKYYFSTNAALTHECYIITNKCCSNTHVIWTEMFFWIRWSCSALMSTNLIFLFLKWLIWRKLYEAASKEAHLLSYCVILAWHVVSKRFHYFNIICCSDCYSNLICQFNCYECYLNILSLFSCLTSSLAIRMLACY